MKQKVIHCNICPLVEPYIGECWICEDEDILIAHDTACDESVCLECVDAVIFADDRLQRLWGNKIHRR